MGFEVPRLYPVLTDRFKPPDKSQRRPMIEVLVIMHSVTFLWRTDWFLPFLFPRVDWLADATSGGRDVWQTSRPPANQCVTKSHAVHHFEDLKHNSSQRLRNGKTDARSTLTPRKMLARRGRGGYRWGNAMKLYGCVLVGIVQSIPMKVALLHERRWITYSRHSAT